MYSTEEGITVLQDIDEAHRGLLAAVAGLSDGQSNFKPASGGWSIAEIVEHLAIVEDRIIARIHQLLASPLDSAQAGAAKTPDGDLRKRVVDRSSKFRAPDAAHPTGQRMSHSVDRLIGSRNKIKDILQSAPSDFRQRSMVHPAFGPLDCHQWLVTLGGHCLRHTQQITETKRDPNFPRT